jgi:photosystem II stability/assembly factor-like uncharacterized protein
MTEAMLLIGTRKGLFTARSADGRAKWEVSAVQLPMNAVYAVGIDARSDPLRLFASADSPHWGPGIFYSDDRGASWQEPAKAPVAFPADAGAAVARVWQIQPGTQAEPEVVYAGTEPSALFRSTDRGVTFELVRGLWDHPHRAQWQPGGGGQAIHTVLPHPDDPARMLVAMSAGGAYRTTDGGQSWQPANRGVRAHFMLDQYPEFGQCVHKIALNGAAPDRLFMQNHGGVYRSDDWGGQWVSIADGLPSDFGFAVAVHPARPGTVYLFPLEADMLRFPPEGRCRVYRSDDAGNSWCAFSDGLPTQGFWAAVMRDALCTDSGDPAGIYFGTRSGEVYASADDGETWTLAAAHLPDVLCVRALTVV